MQGNDIIVEGADGPLVSVTLNRPAKRNCVSLTMWRELAAIFTELGGHRGVRAIVLTGAGGNFCSGADISEFRAVRATAAAAASYEGAVDAATHAIRDCPKPTIARISGYCVGGGCGLALACDFRIADATARLGIPAARLGIVYGLTDCRLLVALVGLANAKRMLYTGEIFSAREAEAMGLVGIPDDDIEKATRDFAERLAANAPLSIAGSKLILNGVAFDEVERRHAAIDEAIATAAESRDYREAARAFIAKRAPTFRGE